MSFQVIVSKEGDDVFNQSYPKQSLYILTRVLNL